MLFGTLSGGLGAKLAGGNFWQGAATGLIVSGLNHVAHQFFYPKGEVYNFFNKEDSKELYEAAEKYKPKPNTITIFAHGTFDYIRGPNGYTMYPEDLHNYLMEHSPLYRSQYNFTIELFSCNTGYDGSIGFALNFSLLHNIVTAPNSYVYPSLGNALDLGGKWNTFFEGHLMYQSLLEKHIKK